jgi:AcrR family transcriptional regulator
MPESPDTPVRRRDRLRAQTTAEILDVARRHLAEHGAQDLSLRAVARDLDMGVSSLYRYFPSRDDLLTALLIEAFDAQADAVAAAASHESGPAAALRAACRAYRAWSLAHPPEFALAYGTPVPGYAAPAERTIAAGTRVGGILIDQLQAAWDAGLLSSVTVERRAGLLTVEERHGLEALLARRGYRLPAGAMSLAVDLFVRVHGFVVMEAFGQLRPLLADPAVTFARAVDDALAAAGLAGNEPAESS